MADEAAVHCLVLLVGDVVQTEELESRLASLPLKGAVSLSGLAKACRIEGISGGRGKHDIVGEILYHHWDQVILKRENQSLVVEQLQKLPMKGPVSLRTLLTRQGKSGASRLNKTQVIEILLEEKLNVEEVNVDDSAVEMVKEWLLTLRGTELDGKLRESTPAILQKVCSEIGCGPSCVVSSSRKQKLVQQLLLYQDDFKDGLPWVDRGLASTVAAVATFRQNNEGNLPKRVHRTKGATEEDNLAKRWRKVVNKKENWNGRSGLSAAEVEYVEAILGKDVWSAKPPLEDYIAGDSFAKKSEVNSNSRVGWFLFYLPVSRRTKKTPKHEPQEKPLLRTLLAGMISKQALGF